MLSPDAEIRLKAKQIMADQMADAMKAAALMIVGRKLDEIRSILSSAGLGGNMAVVAQGPTHNPSRQPGAQASPIEHPCIQCGRESVRRTRPNKFNPTGSWYCQAHAILAASSDIEDRIDAALLGNTGGPPIVKKPAVSSSPPAQMVPQAVPQAPPMADAQEAPQEGSDSAESALVALGVN